MCDLFLISNPLNPGLRTDETIKACHAPNVQPSLLLRARVFVKAENSRAAARDANRVKVICHRKLFASSRGRDEVIMKCIKMRPGCPANKEGKSG
jgi:hypothetical protein